MQLVLSCLIITGINADCWRKNSAAECVAVVMAEFKWTNKAECVPATKMKFKMYNDKIKCCMEECSADATGYSFRKCSGITLKQQFDKFRDESSTLKGKSKPIVHKHQTTTGHTLGVIRKSAKPEEHSEDFSVLKRSIGIGQEHLEQEACLYGDYFGDYIYYATLSSLFGDKLMLHFQNEIEKVHGKWEYYYRPYFPMSRYKKLTDLTVKNVMEIALIAWLDILFMNNDRFIFQFLSVMLNNVEGNLMVDNYESGAELRVIPIDNGAMKQYSEKNTERRVTLLSERKAMMEDIILNRKGLNLWKIAQDFVDSNSHSGAGAFPKGTDLKKVEIIVFNTWYNYGGMVAKRIENILKDWSSRAKDPLFDGRGGYWEKFLKPTLELCAKMPGNVVVEKGQAIYGKKKMNFGLMKAAALKSFDVKTFFKAHAQLYNFYDANMRMADMTDMDGENNNKYLLSNDNYDYNEYYTYFLGSFMLILLCCLGLVVIGCCVGIGFYFGFALKKNEINNCVDVIAVADVP